LAIAFPADTSGLRGFLRQIFDVDGRAHAATQELEKAPVPAPPPAYEEKLVRHSVQIRRLTEEKWVFGPLVFEKNFVRRHLQSQPFDFAEHRRKADFALRALEPYQ
jgi:hypothetical protein